MDVTFVPLAGQDSVGAVDAGVYFKAGETKSFPDDVAKRLLTNPNFVDAKTGKNPNFTCASCGKPVMHMVTDADGKHVFATQCVTCDKGSPAAEAPSPALAEPIPAFAQPAVAPEAAHSDAPHAEPEHEETH